MLDSVTVPEEIWIALEIANDGADDSVTILVTALDNLTVSVL